MKKVEVKRATKPVSGELSFPGDKSLSHRAIIFGSLSEGVSHFTNVLTSEDCECTRKAFEAMGVSIHSQNPSELEIKGLGLHSLKKPAEPLYLGNSGTSMRILSGILAGQKFESVLTGDPSLSSRPMKRVTSYLKQMGARIDGRDDGNFAPLTIHGAALKPISVSLVVSSAQVKSAILLAGLYASGKTSVSEPEKSRDHTELFLKYFGAKIEEKGTLVSMEGGQALKAQSFSIAGDISSAAFFMAIAALLPGAKIHFKSVLWNPTRVGVVDVLRRMGAKITVEKVYSEGPEEVADFWIESGPLKAFRIEKEELPRLIDEIPILSILASQATGESAVLDADELRVKETDRIASMAKGLKAMGANVRVEGNSMFIKGPTKLVGAEIDSFKDHRTAMSFIVAGLVADGKTVVKDLDCINTSFPNFFELLKKVGVDYRIDSV